MASHSVSAVVPGATVEDHVKGESPPLRAERGEGAGGAFPGSSPVEADEPLAAVVAAIERGDGVGRRGEPLENILGIAELA